MLRILGCYPLIVPLLELQSCHHGWCEQPAVTGRDRVANIYDMTLWGQQGTNKLLPCPLSSEGGG